MRQKIRGVSQRAVPIAGNLYEWLKLSRARGWDPEFYELRAFKRIRKSSGLLTGWPEDVMRHSFTTYYLAAAGDRFKVAEAMGNSPEVVEGHYLDLARRRKSEAAEYWEIGPERFAVVEGSKAS